MSDDELPPPYGTPETYESNHFYPKTTVSAPGENISLSDAHINSCMGHCITYLQSTTASKLETASAAGECSVYLDIKLRTYL